MSNRGTVTIDYSDVRELNPHIISCPTRENPSFECSCDCIKYNKSTFELFKDNGEGPEGYMPSYMFLPTGDIPPFFYSSDGRKWSMPKQINSFPVTHFYFTGQFYEEIVSDKFIPKQEINKIPIIIK